jgi:hypothetical protein
MYSTEIVIQLNNAQKVHVCVNKTLQESISGNERTELLARFLSVVISHHEAILVLLLHKEGRLTGSGLVLLRSLIEAGTRGLFAAFIATDEQVAQIKNGAKPYPSFNEMTKAIDALFGTDPLFARLGGDTWESLCGFTHTGVGQLSRRKRPDGTIGAGYTHDDILQLIKQSTAAFIMTAIPFLEFAKRTDAAKVVSDRYVSLFKQSPTLAPAYSSPPSSPR